MAAVVAVAVTAVALAAAVVAAAAVAVTAVALAAAVAAAAAVVVTAVAVAATKHCLAKGWPRSTPTKGPLWPFCYGRVILTIAQSVPVPRVPASLLAAGGFQNAFDTAAQLHGA